MGCVGAGGALLAIWVVIAGFLVWEMRTSRTQARVLSRIAAKLTYRLGEGESAAVAFPSHGPYDARMGYVRIPEWQTRLRARGYRIVSQARWSEDLLRWTERGLFPACTEKTQAGVTIYDRAGRLIMRTRFPERVYAAYDSVPPILVKMLLYIENRDLLAASSPWHNPAIDWKRQGKAISAGGLRLLDTNQRVFGGSTLATQIEKFRHSPDGITPNPREKLRQIASASLRAYRTGPSTVEIRRSIVRDYLNSVPLAAVSGYGEVNGLGDGLWAWYGLEFGPFNAALWELERAPPAHPLDAEAGRAVRAALSLFLAQRRPSTYLLLDRRALRELTDAYLRRMAEDRVISPAVRDAALAADPQLAWEADAAYRLDSPTRKAAGPIRTQLLALLGVDRLYDLDRLDVEAATSLDADLQERATRILIGLRDRGVAQKAGLIGPHLLEKGDPAGVTYSFTLYETRPEATMLRVQTSTFEGPFNIDEQTKLDLGSTAKLRTLVHYLEIVAQLHQSLAGQTPHSIGATATSTISPRHPDPLSRWAADFLREHPRADLRTMLGAAMQRRYSASPTERFFTGGGMHSFSNFNRADDRRVMSVREAFVNSVNLVFVRLMRDVVAYHVCRRYGTTPGALDLIDDAEKRRLLAAFADREGIVFLRRFYERHRDTSPDEATRRLVEETRPSPARLAAVFRYVNPQAGVQELSRFLNRHLVHSRLTNAFVAELYTTHAPGGHSLASIGYLARIHPLELWVVRYLREHPSASVDELIDASGAVRQEVYEWLFKTRSRRVQLQRIKTIVEIEAFQDIHEAWQRLGYPFHRLIPSYATALGSSADRPTSLAELCGIIQDGGVRKPLVRINSLHFGVGTPYETRFELTPTPPERVLAPEVADVVKDAMLGVVASGTARRLQKGLQLRSGLSLPVGGKTGTGDHRYKTFGPGGKLIEDRVMNRAATFVFFIGDRFFGTITAYVAGEAAADYVFSSSLPVQILKTMLTDLAPVMAAPESTPAASP